MGKRAFVILLLVAYLGVLFHDLIPHFHHEAFTELGLSAHQHDNISKEIDNHLTYDKKFSRNSNLDLIEDYHHHSKHSHVGVVDCLIKNNLGFNLLQKSLKDLSQPILIALISLVDSTVEHNINSFPDSPFVLLLSPQVFPDISGLRGPPSFI